MMEGGPGRREPVDEDVVRRGRRGHVGRSGDVRFLGGLEATLSDGDQVVVLPAVAGG